MLRCANWIVNSKLKKQTNYLSKFYFYKTNICFLLNVSIKDIFSFQILLYSHTSSFMFICQKTVWVLDFVFQFLKKSFLTIHHKCTETIAYARISWPIILWIMHDIPSAIIIFLPRNETVLHVQLLWNILRVVNIQIYHKHWFSFSFNVFKSFLQNSLYFEFQNAGIEDTFFINIS